MKRVSTGSVAIEFALIIPILIIVLFSVIQISSLLYMRHTLLNISYNAARIAATNTNTTNTTIKATIEEQLNNIGIFAEEVTIIPDDFTVADRGTLIKVTIRVNAGLLVLVPIPINFDQMPISVSTSMAKEY